MREIQLQFNEQVYRQANQRAVEAGFAGLDEYLADAISELISEEVGDETEVIVCLHRKSLRPGSNPRCGPGEGKDLLTRRS